MEREKQEVLKIIDEIIEKANEIKGLQKRIGAILFDDNCGILIHRMEDLLEYAEVAGENIRKTGYISDSGRYYIAFVYKGYEFGTFVSEKELQEIKEKVLPPTKVTEPNKNNE